MASAVAALFLKQLDMFVLSLSVPYAVRTIVIAIALLIGVALYTVNWRVVRDRLRTIINKNALKEAST